MKKIIFLLTLLLSSMIGSVQAYVDDLSGEDVITISSLTATSIEADKWYTLYNRGRKVYAYGQGEATSNAPLTSSDINTSGQFLIRFVETSEEGKYNIQNSNGSYYRDFVYNSNAGVTSNQSEAGVFSLEAINGIPGYWSIKGSNYYLDCNGSVLVGWSTSAPTNTNGNSSWQLKEVEMCSVEDLEGGALTMYQLLKGGLFRIQNRGGSSQYVAENPTNNQGTTTGKITSADNNLRQMWIIEHGKNSGFSLRNAYTGNYLQANYSCSPTKYYWTVQLSPNNTSSNDSYLVFCHGEVKTATINCMNLNGGSSGLTDWKYNNDRNSEWIAHLVPSSEVDSATVRNNIDNIRHNDKLDLVTGSYYKLVSLNNGNMMTERMSDNMVVAQPEDETAWNQIWKIEKSDNGYTLQNIYSGKYINRKATMPTSVCGGNYITNSTVSNNRYWNIEEGNYGWETTYNLIEPIKPTTAVGVNNNGLTINADVTSTSVQWILKRIELTDEQIAEAQDSYSETELLINTSTTIITSRLQTFFSDYACTTLRERYANATDEELTQAMKDQNLPNSIVKMALKIKNNTWGHREKEFRVYDYEIYSNPTTWNSTALMGTGYQFSPQTGPTGISVKSGDIIVFYVNANAASGTTLKFSSVTGCNVSAEQKTLKRGVNVFVPDTDGFLYIHHTITGSSKKLADVAPVTIHIEGGRVQGYFDITRGHTNADWKDMVENLFQDEIVHMKSKYYQYNMHYSGVLKQITEKELDEIDTDGIAKGIEGTLHRWDQMVGNQRAIMGVDQFLDRFNCLLSASSSSDGNPYASSYGTYYPGVGTIMNYDALTHGRAGDNGGNFWCIAHETGHIHQGLYNMAGCTEISNNCFSQINTWLQGSNTGRGGAWSVAQSSFHKKVFWQEYDLWQRSRAYFQLWLYFHGMKHNENFYPDMFDKLRKQPMTRSGNANNPGSGTTDYLRFAKYACEVAQADLSEFFQFWGFFVPLKNYTVGDYSNSYFTTTQAEIDAALEYMHTFPKKLGNILFIDERIEKYPADYPGMPQNAMRVATTPGVNPGDAAVVGETGMFTQFTTNVAYRPYTANVVANTGKVTISKASGRGAVGFKVYDANNNMILCYNTHSFTIPEEYRSQPYYIVAALGDGTDRLLYDPNDITAVEFITANDKEFDSSAHIFDLSGNPVSQPISGQIYIQNGCKFRMK